MAAISASAPSYRASGVDIAAGAELVERIRPLADSAARPGVMGGLGGFGGLFDLAAAGFSDPVLVAATDGVGTKLRVAIDAGMHASVGIDLVAMCVNDLVVQGAEPLFFLDYLAAGRLDLATAEAVVAGIAAGCREAGCALIGGETAEMPGMYGGADYDLAGFAVGAAERGALLPRGDIAPGDVLLGLPSSGLHANGFSLVRRLLAREGAEYGAPAPFAPGRTWADELLVPTRIYAGPCLKLHAAGLVKGFAHVTGGGLVENIPRALPDGLAAALEPAAWPLPPVFGWLAGPAGVPAGEMARVFNCGLGMIAVAGADRAGEAAALLAADGEAAYRVGEVRERGDGGRVVLAGPEAAWAPG